MIHVFVPFNIYLSPSLTACERILRASDPAFGSVSPNDPISFPSMPGIRYFSFCSSVPNLYIGNIERPTCAFIHIVIPAFTFPISSENIQSVILSIPTPPYCSGKTIPRNPISPSLGNNSLGKSSLASYSSISGSTSFAAKSLIVSLNISCSSVNSKLSGTFALLLLV